MVDTQLDWQQATVVALGLAAAGVTARRWRRTVRCAPYLIEAAIIAALYSLWQVAGSYSVTGSQDAYQRGRDIVRAEQLLHLPSERLLQEVLAGRPLLAQANDLYYATMHFTALGIFLVWLFVRHRDRYPFVRNVLVLVTASSLVIQLVPVAPPRLLPDLGFVDIAAKYGQSVYNMHGISVDQLAAMPSVHVAWALLIAWGVLTCSSSRYRWWVVSHPVITIFVVVATANHFWMDGIVAAGLLVLSIGAVAGTARACARIAAGRDGLSGATPALQAALASADEDGGGSLSSRG
jgi:PAP2 superfamily